MKKVQENQKNQKNQKKKNKGFTLVELIIVIAIIAILAIVLAPQYIKYVEKSRWSNDINQMHELESMVKTAIVEAQEQNATATNILGSITIGKSGNATVANAASVADALSSVDGKWNTYNLKNNGAHASDASTAGMVVATGGDTDTYVITISSDANGLYTVSGAWN